MLSFAAPLLPGPFCCSATDSGAVFCSAAASGAVCCSAGTSGAVCCSAYACRPCLLQRRCCLAPSFAAPLIPVLSVAAPRPAGPVCCSLRLQALSVQPTRAGPVFCSAAAAWPRLLQRRCFRCCLLQRRCCLAPSVAAPLIPVLSFAAPLLPGPICCRAGASGAVFCSAAAAWPLLLQRH